MRMILLVSIIYCYISIAIYDCVFKHSVKLNLKQLGTNFL